MALNPPLLAHIQLPAPIYDELFLLERRGLKFEGQVQTSQGKTTYKGEGKLFLSSLRLVFVCKTATAQMQSFDLPLAFIHHEKFNQPIFGCNNLEGMCEPLPGFPGAVHFHLYFTEGGVGTFLPLFFELLNRNRHGPRERPLGIDPTFNQSVITGQFSQAAFVDPDDPTKIFLTQPVGSDASREVYHREYTRQDYFEHGPMPTAPPPEAEAVAPPPSYQQVQQQQQQQQPPSSSSSYSYQPLNPSAPPAPPKYNDTSNFY